MKIISWNVNGLRSVVRKNFLDSIEEINPDVICLQEVKGAESDINIPENIPVGYSAYFNTATKKGYSGVAVFSKVKPLSVEKPSFSERFDTEGRILKLNYRNFSIINIYIPHGGREKENLEYKMAVYESLIGYIESIKDINIILCGDFNIAHSEIDLARPKNNKNNIMFTPEERNLLDKLISIGFTDSFRYKYPESVSYTWWPYYRNARERNIGWRIDYIFTSKNVQILNASILTETRGSDHCPICLDI